MRFYLLKASTTIIWASIIFRRVFATREEQIVITIRVNKLLSRRSVYIHNYFYKGIYILYEATICCLVNKSISRYSNTRWQIVASYVIDNLFRYSGRAIRTYKDVSLYILIWPGVIIYLCGNIQLLIYRSHLPFCRDFVPRTRLRHLRLYRNVLLLYWSGLFTLTFI